jgi:hypothetical protein
MTSTREWDDIFTQLLNLLERITREVRSLLSDVTVGKILLLLECDYYL